MNESVSLRSTFVLDILFINTAGREVGAECLDFPHVYVSTYYEAEERDNDYICDFVSKNGKF